MTCISMPSAKPDRTAARHDGPRRGCRRILGQDAFPWHRRLAHVGCDGRVDDSHHRSRGATPVSREQFTPARGTAGRARVILLVTRGKVALTRVMVARARV